MEMEAQNLGTYSLTRLNLDGLQQLCWNSYLAGWLSSWQLIDWPADNDRSSVTVAKVLGAAHSSIKKLNNTYASLSITSLFMFMFLFTWPWPFTWQRLDLAKSI